MVKKSLKIGLVCLGAIAIGINLGGCKDKSITNSDPDPVVENVDSLEAVALFKTMGDEAYNTETKGWKRWPGTTGKYLPDTTLWGKNPHLGPKAFQTFINAAAYNTLIGGTFPLVDGAVIVKENYAIAGADTTLVAYTVMKKKMGYNPDASDWFWAKYDGTGNVLKAGKVGGCIGCHKGTKSVYKDARDLVWTRLP